VAINVQSSQQRLASPRPPRHETRREFLRLAASSAVALALPEPARILAQAIVSAAESSPQTEIAAPSRVVRLASKRLVAARSVNSTLLRESIIKGLCALTDASTVADAWHRLLRPDDVILLKFNQSGAERIATTPPVARALILSLQSAGWSPEQIMVLEAAGDDMRLVRQTRTPDVRWQGKEVHFGGSGADSFIAALDQATAVINVPFLKTHHLATMTGGLKNLSHGLIRHPARFHANGCDPAIAEIVASAPIRERLRLNILNALQVVYDGGPDAKAADLHAAGEMVFSTDPVAGDATGFGILNEIRALHGLNPLLPAASIPRFLASATRLGIGHADAEKMRTTLITI
jgi:uncharacterized protein (DUF362 family)